MVPEDDKNAYDVTQYLLENGYIEQEVTRSGAREVQFRYSIAQAGKTYLYQQKRALMQQWIPYSITTIIAVAALILSVLTRLGY